MKFTTENTRPSTLNTALTGGVVLFLGLCVFPITMTGIGYYPPDVARLTLLDILEENEKVPWPTAAYLSFSMYRGMRIALFSALLGLQVVVECIAKSPNTRMRVHSAVLWIGLVAIGFGAFGIIFLIA